MPNDHEKFMLEALKEANRAFAEDEVPVGAVLVHNGRVVAKGRNQVEKLKDATAHAEILCLSAAYSHFNDWRLENTILYCTLEPCLMCMGAIINSRVKKIVYAANDIRVGALGSFINILEKKHPIHEVEVEKNILAELSSLLLKKFFDKKRSRPVFLT